MTRFVAMRGGGGLGAQQRGAWGRNEIDIAPPLPNPHTLEFPPSRPPYYKEVELPQFTPFRVGRLEIDLSPTRHVVFLVLAARSEEHTSELQSRLHLVCRLLLEKKKNENHGGAIE